MSAASILDVMDSFLSSISSFCSTAHFCKIQLASFFLFALFIFVNTGPRGKRGPPGANGINGNQIYSYYYKMSSRNASKFNESIILMHKTMHTTMHTMIALFLMDIFLYTGIPGIQAWKHSNNASLLSINEMLLKVFAQDLI